MTLRISANSLRIRLSSSEARRLLEKEHLEEEFRVIPSEHYLCSVKLGDAQLIVQENGFFCSISRESLLGALQNTVQGLPVEQFFARAGFEVSVDIDVFERG